MTRRERPTLRFTGLAIPAEGRGEFIAAGVAAFAAYALNGLFASVVPGFTTAMLHHADYAIAGGITCLFFAAGAVAALSLAHLNSRPVLLAGLGGFLPGLALVLAGMSTASLVLFGIGAVVAGSAFGALIIGSLSAANRLAPEGTRAKVISTYFVFAYSGLSIPVVGVGIASDYVGNFRAVLGCSIVLAVLCALSAARISGGRRTARPRLGPVASLVLRGHREIAIDDEHGLGPPGGPGNLTPGRDPVPGELLRPTVIKAGEDCPEPGASAL